MSSSTPAPPSSEGGFDINQDQLSQVKDLDERLKALIMYKRLGLWDRYTLCANNVYRSIEAHPEFNKQTPYQSASKTVYYTWDFVNRTRHILSTIDVAKLQALDKESTKTYIDVIGRNRLSYLIITDMSGQMQRMITQGGSAADFGATARSRVEALRPTETKEQAHSR